MTETGTHKGQVGGLPLDLAERIRQEAEENDKIYDHRPVDELDMAHLHYFQAEMVGWAVQQLGSLEGARILDVGIGEGYSSVLMALAGADVTGIEVSPIALAHADELARRHGVKLDLHEMPGEELRFEDGAFDGVLCISAYHHMDQDRAASEFARVLKPGGRLAMMEPLATNPPAWLYRNVGQLFSREATSRETPLYVKDVATLRKYFEKVEWSGKYFVSVGLIGLERITKKPIPFVLRASRIAFRLTSPLDSALLAIPGLQRAAWKIAITAQTKK
jgi:2-polyprenyl-3-methyl-5-hydroxy-6-metoxy-1,4-benzoquinol methylase